MDEIVPEITPTPVPTVTPAPDMDTQQIMTTLGEINAKLDHSTLASDVIITYGYIYVPLIIVVVMLWWFFRQFINQYR